MGCTANRRYGRIPRCLRQPTPARRSWRLLDGICTDERLTDERLMETNAACEHRLFGPPLTLLHKQTNRATVDLLGAHLARAGRYRGRWQVVPRVLMWNSSAPTSREGAACALAGDDRGGARCRDAARVVGL